MRRRYPCNLRQRGLALSITVAVAVLIVTALGEVRHGVNNGERSAEQDIPHIELVKADDRYHSEERLNAYGVTFDFAIGNASEAKPPIDVPSIYRAPMAKANNTTPSGEVSASAGGEVQEEGRESLPESSSEEGHGCNWDSWTDHWSPGAGERDGCCVCHKYSNERTVRACMSCCCSKGYLPWRYTGCKGMSTSANPECAST